MMYKLEDLKIKSVINIRNGSNLGFIDDIVMDISSAKIISLVIYGRKKFFGILGREEDVLVNWDDINMIGDDVVLVNIDRLKYSKNSTKKNSFLKKFFK